MALHRNYSKVLKPLLSNYYPTSNLSNRNSPNGLFSLRSVAMLPQTSMLLKQKSLPSFNPLKTLLVLRGLNESSDFCFSSSERLKDAVGGKVVSVFPQKFALFLLTVTMQHILEHQKHYCFYKALDI